MATATAKPKTENKKTAGSANNVDDVLGQIQSGGQSAIGAVRRFLDKVDESVAGDRSPSVAHDIADSALEMSDRLVEQGGDALRNIARSVRS